MEGKKENGLSSIVVIILGLSILMIGVFVFYFISTSRVDVKDTTPSDKRVTEEQKKDVMTETAEISDSDEIDVIEQELEDTIESSFEPDLQKLDEEASSL